MANIVQIVYTELDLTACKHTPTPNTHTHKIVQDLSHYESY